MSEQKSEAELLREKRKQKILQRAQGPNPVTMMPDEQPEKIEEPKKVETNVVKEEIVKKVIPEKSAFQKYEELKNQDKSRDLFKYKFMLLVMFLGIFQGFDVKISFSCFEFMDLNYIEHLYGKIFLGLITLYLSQRFFEKNKTQNSIQNSTMMNMASMISKSIEWIKEFVFVFDCCCCLSLAFFASLYVRQNFFQQYEPLQFKF